MNNNQSKHKTTQNLSNAFEITLQNLGFTEKEIVVYTVLFEIGRGTTADIAKKANLKKGITYAILYRMKEMELVTSQKIDGATIFTLLPPAALLNYAAEQQKKLEGTLSNLNHLQQELQSQYKTAVGKPTIQYFEGEEGLKMVFKDIYAPKKEAVYGCVDIESVNTFFQRFIVSSLIPDRVKNKIHVESILADSEISRKLHKKDKEDLRKSVLVNGEEYPLPAEIDVYEDKIAMLSFENNEFIGVLIENKVLAETLRSVFKLALATKQNVLEQK